MPQMAPMSWLTLFMFFTIMLIVFSTMNYYSFIPKSPSIKNILSYKTSSMNWKW